jgi:hypothetical protein
MAVHTLYIGIVLEEIKVIVRYAVHIDGLPWYLVTLQTIIYLFIVIGVVQLRKMTQEAGLVRNLYMPPDDDLGMAACAPQFQIFYILHVRYMVEGHAFRSDNIADE